MFRSSLTHFFSGLLTGMLGTGVMSIVMLYSLKTNALELTNLPEDMSFETVMKFIYDNLQLSIIPFAIVAIFYLVLLKRLNDLLQQPETPMHKVVQLEHLLDTSISLFFGIGVIWTAIGMRSALIYALGDPSNAAEAGAFAILQRMVDGGILLALSTTIFGGVGGYLMRIVKSLALGSTLQGFYNQAVSHSGEEVHETLKRIENYLELIAKCKPEATQ